VTCFILALLPTQPQIRLRDGRRAVHVIISRSSHLSGHGPLSRQKRSLHRQVQCGRERAARQPIRWAACPSQLYADCRPCRSRLATMMSRNSVAAAAASPVLGTRRVFPRLHQRRKPQLVGRLPICVVGAGFGCGHRESNGSQRAGSARCVGMLRRIEGVAATALSPFSRRRCGY
jgi:hypothetical protein